jgi:hypothetical protein
VHSPRTAHLCKILLVVVALGSLFASRSAMAAGKKGDFLQTDTLGVNLITRDMTTHATRTVSDAVNLSEYVGLHYYALERVRFGMSLQLTERLWPKPPTSSARIQRFAFLPQVGWNFYDPFFAGLILVVAPRSEGRSNLALGVNAIGGLAIPLGRGVCISAALEVPYAFYKHQQLGLTALTGVSFRF